MQIKKIRVGSWVETTQGNGVVLRVGGTHPPSVRVRIMTPFPRGEVFLRPRDVLNELRAPNEENTHEAK